MLLHDTSAEPSTPDNAHIIDNLATIHTSHNAEKRRRERIEGVTSRPNQNPPFHIHVARTSNEILVPIRCLPAPRPAQRSVDHELIKRSNRRTQREYREPMGTPEQNREMN
jgi:hypothetical protein